MLVAAFVAVSCGPFSSNGTPTPITRTWTAPDKEVEVGFGFFKAVKLKLISLVRTNDASMVNDGVLAGPEDELVIATIEYRSTQGEQAVNAPKDFYLEGPSRTNPLPTESIRSPSKLLSGQFSKGQVVFRVRSTDDFTTLVYSGGAGWKFDVAAGGGPIQPSAVAAATLVADHVANALDYRKQGEYGLALAEIQNAQAIHPQNQQLVTLDSDVRKAATTEARAAFYTPTPRPPTEWEEFIRYSRTLGEMLQLSDKAGEIVTRAAQRGNVVETYRAADTAAQANGNLKWVSVSVPREGREFHEAVMEVFRLREESMNRLKASLDRPIPSTSEAYTSAKAASERAILVAVAKMFELCGRLGATPEECTEASGLGN